MGFSDALDDDTEGGENQSTSDYWQDYDCYPSNLH